MKFLFAGCCFCMVNVIRNRSSVVVWSFFWVFCIIFLYFYTLYFFLLPFASCFWAFWRFFFFPFSFFYFLSLIIYFNEIFLVSSKNDDHEGAENTSVLELWNWKQVWFNCGAFREKSNRISTEILKFRIPEWRNFF